MKLLPVLALALAAAYSEGAACIGGAQNSNPCVVELTTVAVGDGADGVFDPGSVNLRYVYNGSGEWFWTNSGNKNLVLSLALSSLATGTRVVVDWESVSNGTGHVTRRVRSIQIQR